MAWQTIDQQYEKNNDKNDRSNYLKDILIGLQIANNNDPWTLAGFGLGRFLSNYLTRGEQRRREEKRNNAWENRTENENARTIQGTMKDNGKIASGLLAGIPFVNDGQNQIGAPAGNSISPEDAQMAFQQQYPWAKYIGMGLMR